MPLRGNQTFIAAQWDTCCQKLTISKTVLGGKYIATEVHISVSGGSRLPAELIQTLDWAVRSLAKGAHGLGDATLATRAPRCRLPSFRSGSAVPPAHRLPLLLVSPPHSPAFAL